LEEINKKVLENKYIDTNYNIDVNNSLKIEIEKFDNEALKNKIIEINKEYFYLKNKIESILKIENYNNELVQEKLKKSNEKNITNEEIIKN